MDKNPIYCKGFIFMIGKLPTLSSSRALVTSLFLYYDATKFSKNIPKTLGFDLDDSPDTNSPKKIDHKEVFILFQ